MLGALDFKGLEILVAQLLFLEHSLEPPTFCQDALLIHTQPFHTSV